MKSKSFFSILRGKYCLIHLEIVQRPKNEIITLKSYLKQDNVAPHPHTTLSCLHELDFDVKFPLLRLLLFLSDLKSTILSQIHIIQIIVTRIL